MGLLPAVRTANVHAQHSRGLHFVQNGDKCGVSNDFWNLYDADIERAVALNCKVLTAVVHACVAQCYCLLRV